MNRSHSSHNRVRGFTLIELLVVVSIIALLISILLPSLAGARRKAKTVVCASKIKAINLAMIEYATEFQGAIVGSAYSSGALLYQPGTPGALSPSTTYGDNNCPNIVAALDFMSPLAAYMKIPFETGNLTPQRYQRFMTLDTNPNFQCPENDTLALPYGSGPGVHPMIAYNTAWYFLVANGGSNDWCSNIIPSWIDLGGYVPKIDRVGNTSQKIFLAEGGRWWNGSLPFNITTDFSTRGNGSPGVAFGEQGIWSANTRAYLRGTGAIDGRSASMRHGSSRQGNQPLSAYAMNVGFFDGHAETMNGLDAADPNLWCPLGSTMTVGQANSEAASRYWGGASSLTMH